MVGDRKVVGLTENVTIVGKKNKRLVARIDTGATKSSVDSKIASSLKLGPVIRTKLVKSASGNKLRPVVEGKVRLKGRLIKTEFTLADRSHMKYKVLIGQNVLKDGEFLVDPLKKKRK